MPAKKKRKVFTTGVNLSDERRFEAGDAVPDDISKADREALKEVIADEDEVDG